MNVFRSVLVGVSILWATAAWAQATAFPVWGANILCTWVNLSIVQTHDETCDATTEDAHAMLVRESLPRLQAVLVERKLATYVELTKARQALSEGAKTDRAQLCQAQGTAAEMSKALRATRVDTLDQALRAHIELAPAERVVMCFHPSRHRSTDGTETYIR